MNLSQFVQLVKKYQADIALASGVILISLLSFALGYIVSQKQAKTPLKFEQQHEQSNNGHYRRGHSRALSGREDLRTWL